MLSIAQLIAKEYNINVLNFDLWFRPIIDDEKLIKQFPEDILKEYPHTRYSDKYVLKNFYTNEYYFVYKIKLDTDTKKSYYIYNIYSYQTKKQILTFVSDKYINQDETKHLDYIYFLTNDKLVRIKNTNRFITNLKSFRLYYVSSIPFIYRKGRKYETIAYSLFDSKHVKLPYETYSCKYVLRMYNKNNSKIRIIVNPFNLKLYMQIHSSYDIYCIPSKLLI
jgi:hypothetical protein